MDNVAAVLILIVFQEVLRVLRILDEKSKHFFIVLENGVHQDIFVFRVSGVQVGSFLEKTNEVCSQVRPVNNHVSDHVDND